MAAFLIADAQPHDAAAYRDSGYLEAAQRIAAKHGGTYRIRGGAVTILEGEWAPRRVVMIEFPSMDHLRAWYEDPEYREWIPVRQRLADSRLIAVEGLGGDQAPSA
jgi:uncharacterized protein (DUF1330 family)